MDRTPTLMQKFVAELLGTTFLVFVGPGSITASNLLLQGTKGVFTISELGAIALAFAFAIAAMVYTIGHISGCHINPAVTIAFASTKRISWREASVYIVAQLLGGLVGALLIALAFSGTPGAAMTLGYGATNFSDATTGFAVAILMEIVGTFFLLFVIMGTAVDGRAPAGWAGLIIGLAVAGEILVFGPITNVSLNPSRSIGPVLIQYLFGATAYNPLHLLVYSIGPIVGGILGVITYDFVARGRIVASSAELGGIEKASVEG